MGNDQSYEEPAAQTDNLDENLRQLKELTAKVQEQMRRNHFVPPPPSNPTKSEATDAEADIKPPTERTRRRRKQSVATESFLLRLDTPSKDTDNDDDADTYLMNR